MNARQKCKQLKREIKRLYDVIYLQTPICREDKLYLIPLHIKRTIPWGLTEDQVQRIYTDMASTIGNNLADMMEVDTNPTEEGVETTMTLWVGRRFRTDKNEDVCRKESVR